MDLSMKWLADYVSIGEMSPREFSEAITMSGSKVECWRSESDGIRKVVVGKVLSIEPHPNADKLVVCQVDVRGERPLQIVTGATNVVVGALVPVCLNGATLPNGTKIKTGKLRGELSEGMLCSLGELGLTKNDFPYAIEDGIFLLQEDCEPGQDICSAVGLDDLCVEFEITSNRPDCLSVRGLAREAAATFGVPFAGKRPIVKGCGGSIADELKVSIESPLCNRYMARKVKNVKIGPSPRWMRERLRASGVRPINNLVDITNFVMLEYGQPMHAFDARYVSGNQIVVRNARPGESITTLEGVTHKLNESMLVVCDAEKPAAVAGVMGGEYSGIMHDTQEVIFESASFDGASVRLTAKALGLRTESSARFEKGLNPACCADPLDRACELIELLGCGEVVDGVIDVINCEMQPITVAFEPAWTNRFLGISLPSARMTEILASLGFAVDNDTITVPPYRIDIHHKADIAEEIARIYGYDNIPATVVRGAAQGVLTPMQKFSRQAEQALLGMGCSEAYTYSFISPKFYDSIGFSKDDPRRESVTILNPLGEDTGVMRTTTLPSMLAVLSRNYNNRNARAWMYEISKVYLPNGKDELPDEREKITIGLYDGCDFYTIKGMVETLLDELNIHGAEIRPANGLPFHDYRCAEYVQDGVVLGKLGELHPDVADNYSLGKKTYLAELDLRSLFAARSPETTYHSLPKFPASTRDLSVVCDKQLPALELEKAIRAGVGTILETVSLFDVYEGEQIAPDKKSVSYAISMRAADRTLTDDEADAAIKRALKQLAKAGASIRE